jgi:uncharacterized membrane protein HdeD (DUF308 family)
VNVRNNHYGRTAFFGLGVLILGILVLFNPGFIGLSGSSAGLVIYALGIFLVLIGLIAALVYFRLASALSSVFKQENVLVQWKYTPQEWETYTEREYKTEPAGRKRLFLLAVVITICVGLVFWLMEPDNLLPILLIVPGIIAVTGISGLLSARTIRTQNKQIPGEVVISLDGIYLNRRAHIWKGIGTRLEKAFYEERDPGSPGLIFEYSAPSRGERELYTVRIPVPEGQGDLAKRIAADISLRHLSAKNK